MIYIGSIKDAKENEFDEVWLIVHSPGDELYHIKNAQWVPELAPSLDLFLKYRNAVRENSYNQEFFNTTYVPQFLKELKNNETALRVLEQLSVKSYEKDILLACFCSDESMCHRIIIISLLKAMNAKVGSDYDAYIKYSNLFNSIE